MHLEIKKGDKFRHFKGTIYTIVEIATHTETNEKLVVYKDEQGNVWARPTEMFCSLVGSQNVPIQTWFEMINSHISCVKKA